MLRLARKAGDPRLALDAKNGRREAGGIQVRIQVSRENVEAILNAFRGAAALTEAEGLYGRADERRLLELVTSVQTRFLAIWGETGSGKSSLVLAGLVPDLRKMGHILPVVVRHWDNPEAGLRLAPEANIRQALAAETGLALESFASLSDCIRYVAEQTHKTVVVICDQFEQCFIERPRLSDREPFLKAIGDCIKDYRVPCKFLFLIREDYLGRLAEFDNAVAEPLEQRKRFYVSSFSAADAVRALREMAAKANLNWSDPFIRAVVDDLNEDERVRPIELQLVGAALAVSGINTKLDYARAGKAEGLLSDYLELILKSLSDRRYTVLMMKRLLLTLVADPAGRLALSQQEIAQRAQMQPDTVRALRSRLETAHLVRCINPPAGKEEALRGTQSRFELTHDILAEATLQVTRSLQNQRRQANLVLKRVLEDCAVNPRHTIGLRDWRLIRRYADEEGLKKPTVRSLLRRSQLLGVFKWIILPPLLLIGVLSAIQYGSGHLRLEYDFADRIVVRRGQVPLSKLPYIGGDPILDTGFTVDDLKREKRDGEQDLVHREWGNLQSGVLADERFLDAMKPLPKGTFLCQIGRTEQGIATLQEALKGSD
jgi:hypothetical protein